MQLHAYLNFDGTCAEAFRFYEQNLGGKITMMMTHAQAPGANVPPEMANRVMYADLSVAGTRLMGSDTAPGVAQPVRSSYLCLSVDSTPEAERIFGVLTKTGEVLMPMGETFFAHRFGMARDQFDVLWMIIHERPMQQ